MLLDGICRLYLWGIRWGIPPWWDLYGSGVLLYPTGEWVLTAAHVFNYRGYVTDAKLLWKTRAGDVTVDLDSSNFVYRHPAYGPMRGPPWGYDVAPIQLTASQQNRVTRVPRYPLGSRGIDVLDLQGIMAGWGYGGYGPTGIDLQNGSVGEHLRAGLNRYDAYGPYLPGVTWNLYTQMAFDCDNGNPGNDYFGSDTGYGTEEVGITHGDSGGPTFLGNRIVGVHSYGMNNAMTDVNAWILSTCGNSWWI